MKALLLCVALLCGSAFAETYVMGVGHNDNHQMGTGAALVFESATPVLGGGGVRAKLTGATKVIATENTSWILANGDLYRGYGRPYPVLWASGVSDIAGGYYGGISGRFYVVYTKDNNAYVINDSTLSYGTQVIKEDGQPLTGLVKLSAGAYHAACIDTAGKLWTWGYDSIGQLGDGVATAGTRNARNIMPTQTFVAVASSERTSWAIDTDGKLWAWGDNTYGQLGNGSYDTLPHPIPAKMLDTSGTGELSGVLEVAGSKVMAIIRRETDIALVGCCPSAGGLMFMDQPPSSTPISRPYVYSKIYNNLTWACGRAADGKLYAWGPMYDYDWGINSATPEPIPGSEDIVDICRGEMNAAYYTMYIVNDPSSGAGVPGPVGPAGAKGDTGDIGPAGPQGQQGISGDFGPQGPKGDQGAAGSQGLDGLKGDPGDTGSEGPAGLMGPQGPKGDKGDAGPKGDPGDTGIAVSGATGTPGPQGPRGDPAMVPTGTIIQLEDSEIPPDGYTYIGYTFTRVQGEKRKRLKLAFYRKD